MPLRECARNSTVHVAPRQGRLLFEQPSTVDQATQKPREAVRCKNQGACGIRVVSFSCRQLANRHKQDGFWSSAGEFLQKKAKTSIRRTGKNIKVLSLYVRFKLYSQHLLI